VRQHSFNILIINTLVAPDRASINGILVKTVLKKNRSVEKYMPRDNHRNKFKK
jgi:hypothetical protein